MGTLTKVLRSWEGELSREVTEYEGPDVSWTVELLPFEGWTLTVEGL